MTFKKIALASTVLVALLSVGTANAGGLSGETCGIAGCEPRMLLPRMLLDEIIGCGIAGCRDKWDVSRLREAAARDVPVSPYCATPQGIFVGPWLPLGFGCNANGWQGVVVQ